MPKYLSVVNVVENKIVHQILMPEKIDAKQLTTLLHVACVMKEDFKLQETERQHQYTNADLHNALYRIECEYADDPETKAKKMQEVISECLTIAGLGGAAEFWKSTKKYETGVLNDRPNIG